MELGLKKHLCVQVNFIFDCVCVHYKYMMAQNNKMLTIIAITFSTANQLS